MSFYGRRVLALKSRRFWENWNRLVNQWSNKASGGVDHQSNSAEGRPRVPHPMGWMKVPLTKNDSSEGVSFEDPDSISSVPESSRT
jgi:hypothetical protein